MIFLLTACIVLFASVLQAATGFGFSILALPLLLLIHPPLIAVELNLILSVFLCALMLRMVRHDVDITLLKRLIPGSIFGAPIGLAVLMTVNERAFRIAIAIITLSFLILLLRRLVFKRSVARDYCSGVLAGGFTSAVGMGGIPLLLYFAGAQVPKAVVRATAVAFFLFIYAFALVMQVTVSHHDFPIWWFSVGLFPVSFFGVKWGQWLYTLLSQRAFTFCIYGVLIANSILLMLLP